MATSTSTAADSNNKSCYDVFISHRGPDVKKTFASHLYRRLISHGLRVFLDYQELQVGEKFPRQIIDSIKTASVHVAILSPTYAESQWCLDELVLMLESRAPIIPVFHKVTPAEVRRTRGGGVYARSLYELEKKTAHDSQPRYKCETIEKWRNALSQVADISGLDLEAFKGDEGELVDKVVEFVLRKAVKTQLNVARHPTGLEEKVKEFKTEVIRAGQTGLVGITGLGGVGKTTLAKELFNRMNSMYSKSYILFDVREEAKKSLVFLQRKLLNGLLQLDLHIDNRDQGIEMLKKGLSSIEVFLVLDDVDDVDQVHALLPPMSVLGHESLILITSRDKNILRTLGVYDSSIYKMTGLNTERSRELFCWHAFCQPHPLSGFEHLVDQFLKACDGLPLSLKVFGGLLYGNTNKSFWKDELERLDKILPDEIQKRLQISFDALPIDEKHIFLDIACFFIGESRDTAVRVWDGSDWQGSRGFGRRGFGRLQDRCLVEVEVEFNKLGVKTGNFIRMHDHLRDMGRDLAKQPGWPLRLWGGDGLWQQSSETTVVRGIRMLRRKYHDGYASSDDDDERASFSRHKMWYLSLLDIDIEEDLLKCLLEGVDKTYLLWFRWRNCPCSSLPRFLMKKLSKLRVLEVNGHYLETLWPEELRVPLQLRELRISGSLSKIPKSIGQLQHLEQMVVTVQSNFAVEIPKEFCDLRSLKYLRLGISKMSSLPDSFGNLSTLEHIDLSSCSGLERLPDSFGNLIQLKYLNLEDCSNLALFGGTFGIISTLEYIDLTGCDEIKVLPSQIAHQRSLEKLELKLPNLKDWPGAIGESSDLQQLILETPSLETLPPSLGRDLRNLKYLKLQNCRSLKRLPDSFLLLNQLTEWIMKDCSLRELCFETFEGESETLSTESREQKRSSSLDSSFDKCLLRLQHLQLYGIEISKISFPTGICPNLQHLHIEFCKDLMEVGTLPIALINIELACLPRLRKLNSIQGLTELTRLRELKVSGCLELEELPGLEHLRSLEKLWAYECVKFKSIRCSAQLPRLRELHVYGCSELEELSGLEHFRSLEELWASECVKLKSIQGLAQLTQLRQLRVYGCSVLEELPGLEHLRSLEELWASECVKLKSIQGLAQLTQLRQLKVYGCSELEELPGLEHLRSLKKLWASNCVKLKSIQGFATQLRELEVYGCSELEELSGLEHMLLLEKLWASNCVKLKSMQVLAKLKELGELDVSGCSELEELSGLEHLRWLKKLWASNCVKLKTIQGLANLTQLRELDVSGCSELYELSGLEHLCLLEKLWASNCVKLKSIQGLAKLTQLRELDVSGCSELEELSGLERSRWLKKLWASNCVKLKSIQGLAKLTQLREVEVSGCSELEELPGLEHLRSLRKLCAFECVKLKSIQGLAQLTELQELYVYGCLQLEELPDLEHLRSLKVVCI